jgi:hypothetical protein
MPAYKHITQCHIVHPLRAANTYGAHVCETVVNSCNDALHLAAYQYYLCASMPADACMHCLET